MQLYFSLPSVEKVTFCPRCCSYNIYQQELKALPAKPSPLIGISHHLSPLHHCESHPAVYDHSLILSPLSLPRASTPPLLDLQADQCSKVFTGQMKTVHHHSARLCWLIMTVVGIVRVIHRPLELSPWGDIMCHFLCSPAALQCLWHQSASHKPWDRKP